MKKKENNMMFFNNVDDFDNFKIRKIDQFNGLIDTHIHNNLTFTYLQNNVVTHRDKFGSNFYDLQLRVKLIEERLISMIT